MGAEPTDTELLIDSVTRARSFGDFYDRHVSLVVRYFYRRTGCVETSADLTAETFAAAFVSRRRFRDVGSPALAWLMTIANRQLSHYLRRRRVADRYRRRLRVGPIELTPEDYERVETLADLSGLRQELSEALATLPATQLDAVRYRIVDELPYGEVAARLGCSEGAARVRVSRGLRTLAGRLEAP